MPTLVPVLSDATARSATGVALVPLQSGVPVDVSVRTAFLDVVGGAVGAFLTTLLVGALLVALAPEYTRERMATVLAEPVGSFVYGLASLVFLVLVTVVLAITIIGLFLAVPLALVAYVVWAVGSAVAFLAVADRLVGHEDGWTKPLLVGAGINGLLTLTGVGGLLSFAVGAVGFGAVLRDYLE
jgi:hypothetical protein